MEATPRGLAQVSGRFSYPGKLFKPPFLTQHHRAFLNLPRVPVLKLPFDVASHDNAAGDSLNE